MRYIPARIFTLTVRTVRIITGVIQQLVNVVSVSVIELGQPLSSAIVTMVHAFVCLVREVSCCLPFFPFEVSVINLILVWSVWTVDK